MIGNTSTVRLLVLGDASSAIRSLNTLQGSMGRFSGIARTATTAAATFGIGGLIAAAKAAATFEKQMNILGAVTQKGGAALQRASQLAKQLGADMTLPATSAKDAAVAMTELAKGGLSLKQAMDATRGTLQLAAAAQITAGEAAQYTVTALNAFNLSGKEAGRVADVLAAAANASAGDITDFALAMQQSSASAAGLKIPIEDLMAALVMLANAGIKGSDAGTLLRTTLQRLSNPTKEMTAELARLGVSLFDANGNFVGLRNVMTQYTGSLAGATDAQRAKTNAVIGGVDASRFFNQVLIQGVDAFDKSREAVGRHGEAQRISEASTKGLSGAMDALRSVVETAAIVFGEKYAPAVEKAVRRVAEWVQKLGENEQLQRDVIDAMGTAIGVIGDVARALDRVADAVGGWDTAFKIVLSGLLAAKLLAVFKALTGIGAAQLVSSIAGVGGAVGGIGGKADDAGRKVGLLRLALSRLALLGAITIPIFVLLNRKQIQEELKGIDLGGGVSLHDVLEAPDKAFAWLIGGGPKTGSSNRRSGRIDPRGGFAGVQDPDPRATGGRTRRLPPTGAGTARDVFGPAGAQAGIQIDPNQRSTHPTAGLAGFPAADLFAKPGTPVLAPEDGEVTRVDRSNEGVHSGQIYGAKMYFVGTKTGNTYFITHIYNPSPPGAYRKGAVLGYVTRWDDNVKASHAHVGVHAGKAAAAFGPSAAAARGGGAAASGMPPGAGKAPAAKEKAETPIQAYRREVREALKDGLFTQDDFRSVEDAYEKLSAKQQAALKKAFNALRDRAVIDQWKADLLAAMKDGRITENEVSDLLRGLDEMPERIRRKVGAAFDAKLALAVMQSWKQVFRDGVTVEELDEMLKVWDALPPRIQSKIRKAFDAQLAKAAVAAFRTELRRGIDSFSELDEFVSRFEKLPARVQAAIRKTFDAQHAAAAMQAFKGELRAGVTLDELDDWLDRWDGFSQQVQQRVKKAFDRDFIAAAKQAFSVAMRDNRITDDEFGAMVEALDRAPQHLREKLQRIFNPAMVERFADEWKQALRDSLLTDSELDGLADDAEHIGGALGEGLRAGIGSIRDAQGDLDEAIEDFTDRALAAFDKARAKLRKAIEVMVTFDGVEFRFGEGLKTPSEILLEEMESARALAAHEQAKQTAISRIQEAEQALAAAQASEAEDRAQLILDAERNLADARRALADIEYGERVAQLERQAAAERAAAEAQLAVRQETFDAESAMLRREFSQRLAEITTAMAERKISYEDGLQQIQALFGQYEVPFGEAGAALSAAMTAGISSGLQALADAIDRLVALLGGSVAQAEAHVSRLQQLAGEAAAARITALGLDPNNPQPGDPSTPGPYQNPAGQIGYAEGGVVAGPKHPLDSVLAWMTGGETVDTEEQRDTIKDAFARLLRGRPEMLRVLRAAFSRWAHVRALLPGAPTAGGKPVEDALRGGMRFAAGGVVPLKGGERMRGLDEWLGGGGRLGLPDSVLPLPTTGRPDWSQVDWLELFKRLADDRDPRFWRRRKPGQGGAAPGTTPAGAGGAAGWDIYRGLDLIGAAAPDVRLGPGLQPLPAPQPAPSAGGWPPAGWRGGWGGRPVGDEIPPINVTLLVDDPMLKKLIRVEAVEMAGEISERIGRDAGERVRSGRY